MIYTVQPVLAIKISQGCGSGYLQLSFDPLHTHFTHSIAFFTHSCSQCHSIEYSIFLYFFPNNFHLTLHTLNLLFTPADFQLDSLQFWSPIWSLLQNWHSNNRNQYIHFSDVQLKILFTVVEIYFFNLQESKQTFEK